MTIDIATVLNGSVLSAKSCQFFIDGIPRRGILECTYKEKLEAENQWDDSRDGVPIGSTSGRYSVESFTITFLRSAWNSVVGPGGLPGVAQYLAAKGIGSIGAARFDFIAEYSEPLVPMQTIVDTLSTCRVVGVEDAYAEDIKALVTKVDLMCLFMLRNGLPLFDPKRAVPL